MAAAMRSSPQPNSTLSVSSPPPDRHRKKLLGAGLACLLGGCLDRPVVPVTPTTTNVYVNTLSNRMITKIDLLFMIDNSMSMWDKQRTLEEAVPVLVRRLTAPNCVDKAGKPTGAVADAAGHCSEGRPEFRAIRDIHIGVITSSLGGHGGDQCTPTSEDVANQRTPDDRGELLPAANPAVRGALASWNGSGFLAWDPGQDKHDPPGESNLERLIGDFERQVAATGEHGCGYESSLEAWYRFLVDPEPPISISAVGGTDNPFITAQRGPVNEALLAQRRAFLRPDSLLAIVMLSDENDCSILDDDGTQGFLVSSTSAQIPRASAACQNPNDRCCHSCAVPAPEGCPPNEEDRECSAKSDGAAYAVVPPAADAANLRCFSHKKRFGIDLLHPIQRYVDALTRPVVKNRAGIDVPNPIFVSSATAAVRPSDQVLLAGIVGVPWQDIATEDSWTGEGLEFLTAAELAAQRRWQVILGDGNGPSDALMRESVEPRTGTHPLLGFPLVAPGATGPRNPINGNEQDVVDADDLQYACTFPLLERRPCSEEEQASCDCNADERANGRSLCEYPNGADTEGVQVAAKAYPGVRQLEVLRGVGQNGIVASICPKVTAPRAGLSRAADASYGYNPAIAALIDVFKDRFPSQCLPRSLPIEENAASPDYGHIPCAIVEALPPSPAHACDCDTTRGRRPLALDNPNLRDAVLERLELEGVCGGSAGRACADHCLCQLDQLEGEALTACQDGANDPSSFGYCYVDPSQGIGNPELVAACAETKRRILRFMGDGLPAAGSETFIACVGAALHGSAGNDEQE
jgi:hypothetical protein